MPEDNESSLIQAASGGDAHAFAELVRLYHTVVWSTVYRTLGNFNDAEDVVQEIFLRVLVSLKRFDPKYPFGPWILRIAGNYCIDQLRRKKTRRHHLWSDLSEGEQRRLLQTMVTKPEAHPHDPEEASSHLEIAQILLDRLKPKHKAAFILRVIEGHSYDTVAKILNVPQSTARVRVSRARNELHQAFIKYRADLNGGSGHE
ncbi:MAG: RNA polymerase sigma factor [Acidobacteria bacterium]|nr:RNA polymerase sigma factor [Acidobacteriota bacterium]